MKLRHEEIGINLEKPFANCVLQREKYATVLTQIIETFPEGFVLAINNEWGTGKTTFVKMWEQQLRNSEFKTIYLNAWEHDFDNNPLVAIMSELKSITDQNSEKLFKEVIEKGAILAKSIVPALTKSLIKKYIVDVDDIAADAIKATAEDITELFTEELKEYRKKKDTLVSFRKKLENFITATDMKKPLVFIIDELDRCRPDYAVQLLEQLKHFFSVKGITFVLAIDKKHLGSSICGYYGSADIDTEEYLRRFIDLEYSIPSPSLNDYHRYLFKYYELNRFFYSENRNRYNDFKGEADELFKMAQNFHVNNNITLRQLHKIYAYTKIVLHSVSDYNPTFSFLLYLLIATKIKNDKLYKQLKQSNLKPQDVSDLFAQMIGENINYNTFHNSLNIGFIEALLLFMYDRNMLTDYVGQIESVVPFPVKSLVQERSKKNELGHMVNMVWKEYQRSTVNLGYLLNKIDLLEPRAENF